jgi:hypothetical protein
MGKRIGHIRSVGSVSVTAISRGRKQCAVLGYFTFWTQWIAPLCVENSIEFRGSHPSSVSGMCPRWSSPTLNNRQLRCHLESPGQENGVLRVSCKLLKTKILDGHSIQGIAPARAKREECCPHKGKTFPYYPCHFHRQLIKYQYHTFHIADWAPAARPCPLSQVTRPSWWLIVLSLRPFLFMENKTRS